MTDELKAPILQRPIPPQVVNEGSALDPLDLKEFIQSPNIESGAVLFFAELANEGPLPKGLICTPEGILRGTPLKGTVGDYELTIFTVNDSGLPFSTPLFLSIEEGIVSDSQNKENEALLAMEKDEWEDFFPSVGTSAGLPKDTTLQTGGLNLSIAQAYDRPISAADIYYLLEQYATLTIWDAYNLEPPTNKVSLTLKEASPHYAIYDRGSCLIAAPIDLFNHERTLADALKTARVMADEVYKRGWVIQLAGFDKMMRAAWVELQYLSDKHAKKIEILYYTPSASDLKIYQAQASALNQLIQK